MRTRQRRRLRARLGIMSVAILLLHAALLSEANWAWPAPTSPHPVAMQVRMVEAAVTTPVAAPVAEVHEVPHERPVIRERPRTERVDAISPADRVPAADPQTLDAQAPDAQAPDAPVLMQTALAAPPGPATPIAPKARAEPAPPAASSASVSGDETIPHYRTQMPRATTLRYQVSKGMLHGTGELQWRPQGDRYDITLESKLAGMTLLTQVSSGVFDADGIAPVRFTDARLRRSTVAANFRRDEGKISFSGAREEFPVWPGVQDRVSWMVQLAAIVAAQPSLRQPGAKVIMHVVGANADASVWAFECVGNEGVRTDLGPVNAIKYVREPRGPHDTTAQAWLDPTHHFLPARATLRSGPDDEGYELRLQDVSGTP